MNNQTRIPDHNLDDVEGEKEALVCDEYDRARGEFVNNTLLQLKIAGRCENIDMCDVIQDMRFDKMSSTERAIFRLELHSIYLRLISNTLQSSMESSMESLALSEFERQAEESK